LLEEPLELNTGELSSFSGPYPLVLATEETLTSLPVGRLVRAAASLVKSGDHWIRHLPKAFCVSDSSIINRDAECLKREQSHWRRQAETVALGDHIVRPRIWLCGRV